MPFSMTAPGPCHAEGAGTTRPVTARRLLRGCTPTAPRAGSVRVTHILPADLARMKIRLSWRTRPVQITRFGAFAGGVRVGVAEHAMTKGERPVEPSPLKVMAADGCP